MYRLRPYQQQGRRRSGCGISRTAPQRPTVLWFFLRAVARVWSLPTSPLGSALRCLVFQPSKEILEQNYAKLCAYDILECAVYSASCNSKAISRITFATIGSVKNRVESSRTSGM